MTRWVAVFLLLCGVVVRADEKLDAAVKRLASVSTFAFGPVGYVGVISNGEIDFKFVRSQSASIAFATFEKLYADGNSQAKAYALAGMKKLNRNRYKELLATAEASTDQVEVMSGCVIMRESLGKVAKEIDRGEFRFRFR